MYGAIRLVLLGCGGAAIVYTIANLGEFFWKGIIGIVAAAFLFYVAQFVQPPEAEEAPPEDIETSTDFLREMAQSRQERRRNLDEAAEEAKKE